MEYVKVEWFSLANRGSYVFYDMLVPIEKCNQKLQLNVQLSNSINEWLTYSAKAMENILSCFQNQDDGPQNQNKIKIESISIVIMNYR